MRFVFISSMASSPWGGSEELWSQAAVRLAHEGHQVAASVAYWPQLSPKVTELAKQGIDLSVRKPVQYTVPQRVWLKATRQQRGQETFIWLQQQNPDLVVIAQGGSQDGLEWMKFCCKVGLPFVTVVQCNTECMWPDDERGNIMANIYLAAQKVFCVSRKNLELLEHQIGVPLPNGEVVWNPYNVSPEQPPAWPAERDVWKLACVARLEPAAKGQDLLCLVMTRRKWQDRSVEINLYGTGRNERNLKQLVDRLQLKNVHFRGHVANVTGIWELNHLLVLPSRYEGTPLALVEAMWCGRPAVVTDVGGNAEMCVDGETGFVAAAPTMGLLEQALERAWACRHDWKFMGQAARARAEQLIPTDPVGEFCQQLMKCLS